MADKAKKFDVYFGKYRPSKFGYGEFYAGSIDNAGELMTLVHSKG